MGFPWLTWLALVLMPGDDDARPHVLRPGAATAAVLVVAGFRAGRRDRAQTFTMCEHLVRIAGIRAL
ncbi:hypothetical protein [Streptomyces sp. NPDC059176]|uniref:hypothetical protein n=1 Tax=unclassified Streptomyces TaxID=2593676 RepID=UPI003678BDCE